MIIVSHAAPTSVTQSNQATLQISHLHARIFQLNVRYVKADNGELLSVEYESHKTEERGFFGRKRTVTTERAFFRPIMETVRARLPKDAIVLSDAVDWYNGYIRIFYTIPTPPDQAPII